jgi:branched-chain amino acid transport system permease protein
LAIRLVLVALLAVVSVQARADSTGTATPPAGTSGSAAGATGADSGNAAKHAIDADTDTSSDSPVQKCEDLLPGFDDNPTNIKHEVQQGAVTQPVAVRLTWTRSDAYGTGNTGWIICFFLPRSETNGEWQIDLVDSQKFGKLKRYDVQQLNKLLYLRHHSHVEENPHPQATAWTPYLYYLQQTLNAVTLGCLYALLAVGFTLIYGITRFINLAFGDLYMTAAFSTYVAYIVSVTSGIGFTFLPILLIGAFIIGSSAAAGWTVNRLVFSKLQNAATTIPLVASIAVAIVFREAVRLLQGPRTQYMPQNPNTTWRFFEGLGYDVYLRKYHVFIGLATGAIAFFLWWASRKTEFGRSYRACSQDPRMASLVGVDVKGTIARSFLLSGALTGAAGVFEALEYNAVDFNMGFIIGLKSLIAALLGGIGSVPGAMLGGFLLALIETYTGMLIGFEWHDVVTFAVLAAVLIFKPGGILGTLHLMPADERP